MPHKIHKQVYSVWDRHVLFLFKVKVNIFFGGKVKVYMKKIKVKNPK